MKNYSQNGTEQEVILDYFSNKKDGKFLEIGAFDPFLFSNTRALVEMGWSGVMVEPDKVCMDRLKKEYSNNNKITLIEKAIAEHNGQIEFYSSNGDAVGTTNLDHVELWSSAVNFNKIVVESLSMFEFLKTHGQDVDFLNIDVESTNIDLFNLIPDSFFEKLQLFCIEHNNKEEYILEKLYKFGFKELLFNPENLILCKPLKRDENFTNIKNRIIDLKDYICSDYCSDPKEIYTQIEKLKNKIKKYI